MGYGNGGDLWRCAACTCTLKQKNIVQPISHLIHAIVLVAQCNVPILQMNESECIPCIVGWKP